MAISSIYPAFRSLTDALEHFKVSKKTAYITITDHPESFETIKQGGYIINVLGKGIMKTPGHPLGNQCMRRQDSFFYTMSVKFNLFPVFHSLNGTIRFMGTYSCLDYNKKLAPAGFSYFEFKLYRKNQKYIIPN